MNLKELEQKLDSGQLKQKEIQDLKEIYSWYGTEEGKHVEEQKKRKLLEEQR